METSLEFFFVGNSCQFESLMKADIFFKDTDRRQLVQEQRVARGGTTHLGGEPLSVGASDID